MPYLQTGKLVREKPTGKGKHGLLRWFSVKNLSANTRDAGSIPGWGKSPGGGDGNTCQYSCLENAMDREAWQATVHGFAKSQSTEAT